MTPAPRTTAQRQRALRERRAADGLTEVRGIYARPEHHAAIKAFAASFAKKTPAPGQGRERQSRRP